jgi:hypothetical protein
MSQTSNSSVNIKVKKKKKKKRGHVEGNPFMATLESIKKEMGVQKMTVKQFWIMQQNVSIFYSFRSAFHSIYVFQLLFLNRC